MGARHRLRHLHAVVLVVAGLILLPAAPALGAQAATVAADPVPTETGPFTGADFYTPPTVLPRDNGAVIRYQDSAVGYLGVLAKRIMYKSTDVHGNAVAVTGTVLQPTAPWTGGGDRPLVSYAVGTIGQGDQCAPSILLNQGLEYEALSLSPILAAGVAVVVTDYLGLGTPDRVHSYLNRADEAHAVLDAALAAQNLSRNVPGVDIPADGPVGIYGYSQGGQAAGAAAELQPTYAQQLHLVGSAIGAPPADLASVAAGGDGTILSGALGYAINGFIQDYPQLATQFHALLNQRGNDFITAVKGECLAETVLRFGFQQSSIYTVSGLPFTSFLGVEPFKSIIAEQRVGGLAPTAPVYIWQGRNDDAVPFAQSLQLAKDWCAQGATVKFKEYGFPAILPGAGIGHVLPFALGLFEAQGWLYERFAVAAAGGTTPAPNSCGALPSA